MSLYHKLEVKKVQNLIIVERIKEEKEVRIKVGNIKTQAPEIIIEKENNYRSNRKSFKE